MHRAHGVALNQNNGSKKRTTTSTATAAMTKSWFDFFSHFNFCISLGAFTHNNRKKRTKHFILVNCYISRFDVYVWLLSKSVYSAFFCYSCCCSMKLYTWAGQFIMQLFHLDREIVEEYTRTHTLALLLTYVNSDESCSLVSKLKIYVAYVRIMIMINSLNINDIDHGSDRRDDVESDCNTTRGLNLENIKTQWSLIIDWLYMYRMKKKSFIVYANRCSISIEES